MIYTFIKRWLSRRVRIHVRIVVVVILAALGHVAFPRSVAFGLVPLLFASGPGSEIQRPLAIVVIGGLVTSTALTLVILPLLYRRFGDAPPPTAEHLFEDTKP